MTPDIRISVEEDIVRLTYIGKQEYGFVSEKLREAGRVARDGKCERLLFDIRQTDISGSYADAIGHAEAGPALGIDRRYRIAFLGLRGDAMLKYVEDVSLNRGYQVRAFVDEGEAIAWLRGAR